GVVNEIKAELAAAIKRGYRNSLASMIGHDAATTTAESWARSRTRGALNSRIKIQTGITITAPSRKYRHSQRNASKPRSHKVRIMRWILRTMSKGSSPNADKITPTSIDTSMRRSNTPRSEPTAHRATCFSAMSVSVGGHCSMLAALQHILQRFKPISLARRLVPTQSVDPRETHNDARFMAGVERAH